MYLLRIIPLSFAFFLIAATLQGQIYHRTDTLMIPEVSIVPVIDGNTIRHAILDQILIIDISSEYQGLIDLQLINLLGETICRQTIQKDGQKL